MSGSESEYEYTLHVFSTDSKIKLDEKSYANDFQDIEMIIFEYFYDNVYECYKGLTFEIISDGEIIRFRTDVKNEMFSLKVTGEVDDKRESFVVVKHVTDENLEYMKMDFSKFSLEFQLNLHAE